MTPSTTMPRAAGLSSALSSAATDDLLRRRGELAQNLQMAALEGLPLDEEDAAEVRALDAELARRGPRA